MCSTFLCWLWPFIAGVLCGILGYLLGKSLYSKWIKKYNDLKVEFDNSEKRVSELEGLLDDCKKNSNLVSSRPLGFASIPFDAETAKVVFGKKVKQDDLKIVEGIGPKIEELFNNEGIKTWKELSETTVERCQEILDKGGDSFKFHVPTTWPKQAKLAYEGKWKELLDWQDELDGGK